MKLGPDIEGARAELELAISRLEEADNRMLTAKADLAAAHEHLMLTRSAINLALVRLKDNYQ
jgi:hypothetical protein